MFFLLHKVMLCYAYGIILYFVVFNLALNRIVPLFVSDYAVGLVIFATSYYITFCYAVVHVDILHYVS